MSSTVKTKCNQIVVLLLDPCLRLGDKFIVPSIFLLPVIESLDTGIKLLPYKFCGFLIPFFLINGLEYCGNVNESQKKILLEICSCPNPDAHGLS